MAGKYSVEAVLSLIDKNFSNGFSKAEDKLSGFGKSASKAQGLSVKMGAVIGATGAIVNKAMSVAGNAISGIVGELNQSSATWKTFGDNMKNIGKSSDEINKTKKALQDYATQTVYSASDMATTYSQMAAVGVKDTLKLVKGMGGLAAAAENPAQAMKSLSTQMTQAAAKPKIEWQDFKIMLEQSPAGVAAVAKQMGMSTSELVSKVQDGQVVTQDFFDAIAEAGTNDTFTKMATDFKTVGQAMDGLKEGLANKLMPIFDKVSAKGIEMVEGISNWVEGVDFEGIFNKLSSAAKTAFDTVIKAVQDTKKWLDEQGITGAIESMAEKIKEIVPKAFEVFKEVIPKAFNVVKEFAEWVIANKDFILPLAVGVAGAVAAFKTFNTVMGVVSTVKSLVTTFKGIVTVVKNVGGVFKALQMVMGFMSPTGWIIVGIAAVTAALTFFFTKTKTGQKIWKKFTDFLKSAWETIKATAETVWTWIGDTVSNIATSVQEAWTGVSEFFSNLWQTISDTAMSIWTSISEFFTGLWNGIVEVAMSVWNVFGEGITNIWNGIVSVAQGIWEMLKAVIMGPVLLVIDLVTGNFSQMGEDVSLIWNSIKDAASQIWEGIKTYFSGVLDVIKNYFSTVWNAIKTATTVVWNSIKSGVSNIWNSLVNTGKSLWNGFKSFMSNLWNSIKAAAINGWNGIKSGVINAVNGIVNGAKRAWESLKQSVSNLVSSVKSIFNGIRNIDLFGAGKAIIDGFLKGLKSAYENVKNFVGGIGDWIRDHKGPISYDKRLLIPAGNAIMDGLNKGLDNGFGAVQDNVSSMGDRLSTNFDIDSRLASINSQIQTKVQHEVSYGSNSKPALFNIQLGNQVFQAFVEDINEAQGNGINVNMQF